MYHCHDGGESLLHRNRPDTTPPKPVILVSVFLRIETAIYLINLPSESRSRSSILGYLFIQRFIPFRALVGFPLDIESF